MINKSFHILRTNPALTTNYKFVVSSKYDLFLESIESDRFLNQDRFKRFRLNKDNQLSVALYEFYKNVPEDIAYKIKYDNDETLMFDNYQQQIDPIYFTGARTVLDTEHDEEFEYFAPLHINKNAIPEKFIIFRVDGPGNENINSTNFNLLIDNLKVVKSFDLKNEILGTFLNNNFKNKYFPNSTLDLDFREVEFSRWSGFDYNNGGFGTKSLFLENFFKYELPFSEFDEYLTNNYKRNGIIYPNILNFTFLFDDTPATPTSLRKYSINRYLGFYIDKLDLIENITSYKTYQLITGGNIQNNIFFDSVTGESYDPIAEGWKEGKTYFVWHNGEFHYLTRTLTGTTYEYKIISNTLFDTTTNPLHTTDLFNEVNTQPYTVKIKYNNSRNRNELVLSNDSDFISTLPSTELDKADVFLIKINDNYHTLKYDTINTVFYLVTDYQFDVDEDKVKYWINGEENATLIDFGKINQQNIPSTFSIYRLDFTEITDFDRDIKDTKFAGFEYESKDPLSVAPTSEMKFYPNDYSTSSIEPDLLTNNPVSSEYIANDEYFSLDREDNLNNLWRKNFEIVKFGFKGSISHNDYAYRINNSISNIDQYNRASNPKSLLPQRSDHNLDYFYTLSNPVQNYTNHSLHINHPDLNLLDYITADFDYFTYLFEKEQSFSNGTDTILDNTYKYSIFSNGSTEESSTTLFRGVKFQINKVENIFQQLGNITQISIKEDTTFNDFKFSIIFASKKYDSSNSYALYTGVEPDLGESGVDVYVNYKYKNVLVHIYVNSDADLSVHSTKRDDLYSSTSITGATTLTKNELILSNVFNHLNSLNTLNGFDNYVNYYVIEEDGSFDFTQSYNKNTYSNINLPPFYLTCYYPEELSVKLESLTTTEIQGPMLNLNQPLILPKNQPLARKFNYSNTEPMIDEINANGIKPYYASIYRFNGSYMPIFNRINIFKSVEDPTTEEIGNYKFSTNLNNFGINKEQIVSKVNKNKNLLKLRDDVNTESKYPMIDEFGYILKDMFIFKSTWDNEYYTQIKDNDSVAAPTILDNEKIDYISQEFVQSTDYGTFNMLEQKTFFASKAMDLEDRIIIDENTISFFEENNGEQNTGGGTETINTNFNFNVLKNNNHTITEKEQTELQRRELTNWNININTDQLLTDYLYSSIKKARSFENVLNINTSPNSVNLAILDYIKLNLLDRYEIEDVVLYVQYVKVENDPSRQLYTPIYDDSIKNDNLITKDFSIIESIEDNTINIDYRQIFNGLEYTFTYYFDIIFKRI